MSHNDLPETDTQNHVSKPVFTAAIILTAIFTVAILDWQGMIKHTEHKDDFAISTYKAILIEAQDSGEYRLSRKPSNQTASCNNGYLFIASDINEGRQALLVDYKNRGIKCDQNNLSGLQK